MKFRLRKNFRFEASHQLMKHDGKCARLHGHSYQFTIEVAGDLIKSGPQENMVVDYYHISKAGKAIVEMFDHRHLNDVLQTDMPTAEVIAHFIYHWIKKDVPLISAVEVKETESSWCRYEP